MDLEQLMHLTLNTSKRTLEFYDLPTPAKLLFSSNLMVVPFTKFLRPQILMSLILFLPVRSNSAASPVGSSNIS